MSIVQFVRPLQWAIDLDVSPWEAQLVAEVLVGMPKRRRFFTYRYFALRLRVVQACVISDDVRRDLEPIIARCERVRDQRLTVVGAELAARHPRDAETCTALRTLARDPRILERLGL